MSVLRHRTVARLNLPRLSRIDDEVYILDADRHVRLSREVEFFNLYFSARVIVRVSRGRGYSAVKDLRAVRRLVYRYHHRCISPHY